MKIPLNLKNHDMHAGPSAETRQLGSYIQGAKRNDWSAKASLHKNFQSLLASMAQKRASEQSEINELIDKGKEGINKAAKKFNLKDGPDKFRIFAVSFIEDAMDGKGGGFLSKLFGK